MNTIDRFPIKTRVPLAAWVFAGFLTLLSIASSTVHHIADTSSDRVVSVAAFEQASSRALRASLN
jgi:hypothetical protein